MKFISRFGLQGCSRAPSSSSSSSWDTASSGHAHAQPLATRRRLETTRLHQQQPVAHASTSGRTSSWCGVTNSLQGQVRSAAAPAHLRCSSALQHQRTKPLEEKLGCTTLQSSKAGDKVRSGAGRSGKPALLSTRSSPPSYSRTLQRKAQRQILHAQHASSPSVHRHLHPAALQQPRALLTRPNATRTATAACSDDDSTGETPGQASRQRCLLDSSSSEHSSDENVE